MERGRTGRGARLSGRGGKQLEGVSPSSLSCGEVRKKNRVARGGIAGGASLLR